MTHVDLHQSLPVRGYHDDDNDDLHEEDEDGDDNEEEMVGVF